MLYADDSKHYWSGQSTARVCYACGGASPSSRAGINPGKLTLSTFLNPQAICFWSLQLVQNENGVRMVHHMFASTPSQPLYWCSGLLVTLSIYWLCKLLLFLGSQVQRQLGIRMWLFWKWRSSDFCKKLSIHRLHLQIFWFYYTYRTTWRRVITWCHCMLKFEIVIPSSRIWRPYLVDFRLFSSALSPYYCKDCHWHGRCEFSFICLDCIFSIGASVSYCYGSILI